MKKSQQQMNLDVSNACREIDAQEVHPYQFLFCRMKYGWDKANIEHFYPEQTISIAAKEGWSP